jgi:hypothetical protein
VRVGGGRGRRLSKQEHRQREAGAGFSLRVESQPAVGRMWVPSCHLATPPIFSRRPHALTGSPSHFPIPSPPRSAGRQQEALPQLWRDHRHAGAHVGARKGWVIHTDTLSFTHTHAHTHTCTVSHSNNILPSLFTPSHTRSLTLAGTSSLRSLTWQSPRPPPSPDAAW